MTDKKTRKFNRLAAGGWVSPAQAPLPGLAGWAVPCPFRK